MLKFQRFEAAPALRNFVQGYWYLEAGAVPDALNFVPDGYSEICFNLSPGAPTSAGFIGQITGKFVTTLPPFAQMLYVKLYPWTPYLLFQTPLFELTNQLIDLEVLTADRDFRRMAGALHSAETLPQRIALLDQIFLKKLANPAQNNPFLNFAAKQILHSNGTVSIESLSTQVHASRRYLEKKFKTHIGMTPKQYARLIRVKKASILLLNKKFRGCLSAVSDELEYYDHSHFLKDFKTIVQQTPTDFLRQNGNIQLDGMDAYLGQWDYS